MYISTKGNGEKILDTIPNGYEKWQNTVGVTFYRVLHTQYNLLLQFLYNFDRSDGLFCDCSVRLWFWRHQWSVLIGQCPGWYDWSGNCRYSRTVVTVLYHIWCVAVIHSVSVCWSVGSTNALLQDGTGLVNSDMSGSLPAFRVKSRNWPKVGVVRGKILSGKIACC